MFRKPTKTEQEFKSDFEKVKETLKKYPQLQNEYQQRIDKIEKDYKKAIFKINIVIFFIRLIHYSLLAVFIFFILKVIYQIVK